jgi:sulfur relay (sulfurtransferase) DsrF/TusC family protein
MAITRMGFIVKSLPYKTETTRLAMTHAIATQTVEIYLEDGDNVEAVVAFIGDGVLNCLKGQQAMKHYGDSSIEMHMQNALLLDLNVLVCKEDLERFGLTENDIVMDAEALGGETNAKVVPFSEIQKEMESVHHLQLF